MPNWPGVEFCSHGPIDLFPPRPHWVYYAADPDRDLIKIGTTVNLASRMIGLGKEVQRELRLLAVEIGSYGLERHRHRQFAALRTKSERGNELEWFRAGTTLQRHIEAVGKICGDPRQLLLATCRCQLPKGMTRFSRDPSLERRVEPWRHFEVGTNAVVF